MIESNGLNVKQNTEFLEWIGGECFYLYKAFYIYFLFCRALLLREGKSVEKAYFLIFIIKLQMYGSVDRPCWGCGL